ncbi:MAG: phosphodiester glycosidase family protein [Erysipelotrichaceae bacterium]|nr:phosphodiester glycosidase family protein [Erysipelotrichaceae bacterium]
MESKICIYPLKGNKILRAQIVKADSFGSLHFARPDHDPFSFQQVASLYKNFIVKKYAPVFGKTVIFDASSSFDTSASLNKAFREDGFLRNGQIAFRKKETEEIFASLKKEDKLLIAAGKCKTLTFLPVGDRLGFLSESFSDASLAVNTSFFLMDKWDCASVFDQIGIPIGLMKENETILNPPQYDREAFLLKKDGSVRIRKVSLKQIKVKIGARVFQHGRNCRFYERTDCGKTPSGKTDLLICGNRLCAISPGNTVVPSGGFVIKTDEDVSDLKDKEVTYEGLEDVIFALQAGNSVLIDGVPTKRFISPFNRFYDPFTAPYPPSVYPLSFNKARAPRILFGADENQRPVFVWIEGAGKFGHVAGQESEGATMADAVKIAADAGMRDAIHLDGGGSAQILLKGERALRLSDRDPVDHHEIERAVPMALIIR